MGILLAALSALYYPAMLRLVQYWHRSEDYSHGFLIIPLSLYMIWQKRDELRRVIVQPNNAGLILTISAVGIYVIAEFAGVMTLAALSIIPITMGSIWFLFGNEMLKQLLFPVCFLIFMIPVPGQVYSAATFPLQLFVSTFSTYISQIMSIPVYREGNIIHLPEHTLQVVQACSGLRSMISLLSLSAVFGYFSLRANFLRAVLFASGIPVAIMVNVVRVVAMILAFHYFDMDLTQGSIHTFFGAAIFVLAIILLVALRGILSKWDKSA